MTKARTSAGVLLFRLRESHIEVLVGHMGGPFWARKDEGAWSVPKGEYDAESEDAFACALREFEEEMGSPVPASDFVDLGEARQPSGKVLRVWAAHGEFDAASAKSNTFTMEWPKGSGKMREYPEIDRAEWLEIEAARRKLLKGHGVFLDRLVEIVQSRDRERP